VKSKDVKGYRNLHRWVETRLGKPRECEHCGDNALRHRQYHWANKSGDYLKELDDWMRLCISCHITYDGLSIKYSNRTHCKNGHEYSEGSFRTRVEKRTGLVTRICQTCQKKYMRDFTSRKKEVLNGV